jgi:hypothetical protein
MKYTHKNTATMELTSGDWSVIILALREAKTMPRGSAALAEMLAELVEVQTQEISLDD